MKKTGLVIVAIISVFITYAQTNKNVILHATSALQTTASSSNDNSFIATTPSGENLVASNIKVGGLSYINIKKIHTDGSVSTLVNLETTEPVKGLTCSPTTGYFTCFYGSTPIGPYYLAKFTATGTIIFKKSMNLPFTSGLGAMEYYKNTINENAVGEYYINVSTYGFMGIIKLDANGDLLWKNKYIGPRNTDKCPGFCSTITNSGGCISTMKDENYLCVVNVASDGTLIWSKSYVDMATYRWPRSIKTDNLGNFYILGTYSSQGSSFISKIDANGNFIYAKNVGYPYTSGSTETEYVDSYISTSNELYIIALSPEVVVAHVNATGSIVWNKKIEGTVGSSPYCYSSNFSKTPSANISFITFVRDSTNMITNFSGNPSELCYSTEKTIPLIWEDNGLLGAEIDTLLYVSALPFTISNTTLTTTTTEYYTSQDYCSFMSINETTSLDLNIYPNPATDFVNIELGNLKNIDLQNVVIVVYDMTGKKVFEKQLNNLPMDRISTADYASGLYTIIIANSDTIIAKQRMIVQK